MAESALLRTTSLASLLGAPGFAPVAATSGGAPAAPPPARAEGDDDEEAKGRRAKKAKKSDPDDDDDDDDDDEDDDDDDKDMKAAARTADEGVRVRACVRQQTRAKASARRTERARIAAILQHPKAAANGALAAHLAFATTTGLRAATAMLDAASDAPAPSGLSSRMAGAPNPQIGPGGAPAQSSTQAIDAGWDRSLKNAQASRPAARKRR